jgi:N-hydroxyarylamine O-acetyltransferase
VNTEQYLERIGFSDAALTADRETLDSLQFAHLLTVPFENLDIHWNRPIVLDTEKFYEKIVGEKRGGFCYELNGLFNELLISVGFKTRLISARVFNGTTHGAEYDHAAIIATIDENEFLADVGFGDFSARPLEFVLDREQADAAGTFVIRRFDDEYFEIAKRDGGAWRSQYIFKDTARDLSEFAEMCEHQQHSPESHFTKGKLCSILTQSGRKTLTDRTLITTTNDERQEIAVKSVKMFDRILYEEFAIVSRHRG